MPSSSRSENANARMEDCPSLLIADLAWAGFCFLEEFEIFLDEGEALADACEGCEWVFRRVLAIIDHAVERGGCNMQARVGRRVIDVQVSIGSRDRAVAEYDIGHIADAFSLLRGDEVAAGPVDDLGGIIQIAEERVDDIAESRGSVADAMGDMQPTGFGLDGDRAGAVLGFLDGVIDLGFDDGFLADGGIFHRVGQGKADAPAGARFDERVLRPRVECVFAVD